MQQEETLLINDYRQKNPRAGMPLCPLRVLLPLTGRNGVEGSDPHRLFWGENCVELRR